MRVRGFIGDGDDNDAIGVVSVGDERLGAVQEPPALVLGRGHARGASVVIAMAADVGQNNVAVFCRRHPLSQLRHFNVRHHATQLEAAILHCPVHDIKRRSRDHDCQHGMAGADQSMRNLLQEIPEHVSDQAVRQNVKRCPQKIQLDKLQRPHLHASRQRRRHGVHAGDEFCEDQRHAATFMKRFRRAQDAGFRIQRQAADKAQQGPAGVAANDKQNHIAHQGSGDRKS